MEHASAVWEAMCPETGAVTPYSPSITSRLEGQHTDMHYRSGGVKAASRTVNIIGDNKDRIVVDIVAMQEHSAVDTMKPAKAVIRRLAFQPSPRLTCRLEFTVLETERLFPLFGWGTKRLPTDRPAWANLSGKITANTDKVSSLLAQGFHQGRLQWDDDWTLVIRSDETDKDGWEYAIDFPQSFHAQKHMTDFVRRRKWVRSAHTAVSLMTASEIGLSKELQGFVTHTHFSPCLKDLETLRTLETSLVVQWQLHEALEFNIREAIYREEISDLEEEFWHKLHAWAEADRIDICHALRNNMKQLATAQSDLLDKWTSKRGPRQSAIDIRVISAENVPIRFGATHKLRVGVKFLATDLEMFSDHVWHSSEPKFNFAAFSVVPDDTQPIIVTLEAVAHGVAELVTEPIALGVAPLSVRGKHSTQEIDPTSLVYRERGSLTINCLDERGINPTATNLTVTWTVEPRELSEIEFCDHCGSMIRLCSCTQDEIDARQREQALKGAQRQAEIYAARAKRLATQRAEEEAQNKERREQQKRAFENDRRVFIASESDPRAVVIRDEAEARATILRLGKESLKAIAANARKKELLRVVFKIRIDELHDQRVAAALQHFLLLQQYAHRRREEKELKQRLNCIAAEMRSVESDDAVQREKICKNRQDELSDLAAFEKDQRPLPPPTPKAPHLVTPTSSNAISASNEDKEIVQANFKKEQDSKSCCAVM
jgi:hypothetical protein